MATLAPPASITDHTLAVVTSKTIVGAGTTSSRELKVSLLDTKNKTEVWHGVVRADFEWFLSDSDYRAVGKKLSSEIIEELKIKGIEEFSKAPIL